MNKKGNAIVVGVIIGVIILLIGGGSIFGGFSLFGNANAVRVVDYNKDFCPSYLYFGEEGADFEVTLNNGGENGGLIVILSSNDVLSKDEADEVFQNESSVNWYVRKDTQQNFEFKLKQIGNEERIKVNVEYGCEGFLCTLKKTCCVYDKQSGERYDLKEEKC